ncbi:RNA polymerase sigma factor [Sorangium sp. So ce131]|uniref:RNA polymerase sigma factor n=1 Tax=Sorangium sp. So ce131 TaxID=3133282 RepID=UPI003F62A000
MTTGHSSPATNPLAEPGLRRSLEEFVRRRVPSAEVDDVVQTVLCDALASPARPTEPSELRRWLLGIARHKVADHHRRASREAAAELPDLPVAPPPVEARELARWAEEQASSSQDAQQTLAWMAREGEGEKLESIAAEAQVPAARVRQRVSRMRRWMRERWRAELAAVAALALLALVLARLLRPADDPPAVAPLPEPPPVTPPAEVPPPRERIDRARALRAEALRACDERAFRPCLDRLDEAARLDPPGDGAPDVAAARARALGALRALEETPSIAPGPETSAPAPSPVRKGRPDAEQSVEETDTTTRDVSPSPQPSTRVAPPPVAPTGKAPSMKPVSPKKSAFDPKKSAAPDGMDFPSLRK